MFEPTGDHVYYASRRGTVGLLDRDDVTGFGPEHYFTNCSTLVAGNYEVRVNFFSGTTSNATSQAQIIVDAGITTVRTTRTIVNPQGSAGNTLPNYHINS